MHKLLSRDNFRNAVFSRDEYKCVFCGAAGQDAHHIVERRLWPDGGYYLDNGVTVCGEHHLQCETTELSIEDCRCAAKIKSKLMPPQFYDDDVIDKWGNYILPNGTRYRGELFYDESVQKIIHKYLPLFSKYVKHPRTYHLPWSDSISSDDVVLHNAKECFGNQQIVALEKMDGENTTFYNDYFHARSLDSNNHPSRNRAKAIWASICGDIPEGYRLVVENLYAKHSLSYSDLESYVYGLFVWNSQNVCLSWEETLEWFKLFSIPTPRLLYIGEYNNIPKNLIDSDKSEGYVIRMTSSFNYSQFSKCVAKYVRPNHNSSKNWKTTQIVVNQLKNNEP